MSRPAVRLGVLGLLALTLLLSAIPSCAGERRAPDFTLADAKGTEYSLGKLRNRIVGLYFWATYCPECIKSFPSIEKLGSRYGRRDVVILGVNRQLPELASRFMDRNGFKLRTLHDPYGRVTGSYGITAIPVLVLVDKRGMIARTFYGRVSESDVGAALDSLLRGSALPQQKPSKAACEIIRLDSPPVWSSGRILVPMRGIFQWLGAKVTWSEKARSVTAKKGSRSLRITVGSRSARAGGKSISLDTPPKMIRGRVYVPLRFVGQSLGASVEYRPQDGGILIKSGSRCGFVAVD